MSRTRTPSATCAAVPDDACIVDFPVSATLGTRSGDTATALPSDAVLETAHTFGATDFEDCTREVTVSVPTKGSDGVWMTDRTLTFALSPQAGSDPRVDAGETVQATVRDDTPVPGPVVTHIDLSPVPPEATADHSGPYRKEDFLALPDAAVHGFGAQLMFTITFDIDVTVTLGVTTGGVPELVLDIFGRERRARYTGAGGSGLRTMAFEWTVEQGDYDPNGLAVTGLVVNGATIRDTQGRDTSPETFPAKHFKAHRVRGGLFAMSLDVKGPAEEGEPIEIRVVRNGGTEQAVGALIEITDSGMEDMRPEDVPQDQPIEIDGVRLVGVFFEAEDNTRDIDPSFVTYRMIPAGDGKTNATRTLTFELVETDIRDGDGPKSWYDVGNGEATISVLESGTGTGGPGTVRWSRRCLRGAGGGARLRGEPRRDLIERCERGLRHARRDRRRRRWTTPQRAGPSPSPPGRSCKWLRCRCTPTPLWRTSRPCGLISPTRSERSSCGEATTVRSTTSHRSSRQESKADRG